LAITVSAFASSVGFDRDRAFYPTVMIVIASSYGLFAVMGGSNQALAAELVGIVIFIATATIGFKRNLWIVAAALFAHGVYDLFHGDLISNPGVPVWWPMFCATYDITAAGCVAWLLNRSKISA
jgi:hypothetical protein